VLTTHSITSIFVLSRPVAADQLPAANEPIEFVDESFTRSGDDRTTAIIAQITAHREHLIARLNQSVADQQAQIQQLESRIAKKDEHIAGLENLIRRIESGRLLRFLRWFKPGAR
jgi:hypothetical protein